MIRIISLLFATALITPQDSASTKSDDWISSFDEPAQMFLVNCVLHAVYKNDLESTLDSDNSYLKYNSRQAAPFLQGRSGKVWGTQGKEARYAIARIDSGICATFAQDANIGRARAELKNMITHLSRDNNFEKIPDALTPGIPPYAQSEGWVIKFPKIKQSMRIIMNTNTAPRAIFKLTYMVSITNDAAP